MKHLLNEFRPHQVKFPIDINDCRAYKTCIMTGGNLVM